VTAGVDAPFRIMARKRPLQPQELEAQAYDSISVEGENNAAVVHDGRVHRDGRTLYMTHSRFCVDRIFDERDSNADVYAEALRPLLRRVEQGDRATLLLFGQTGTGKTYTARGVFEELAAELFVATPCVSALCYEIAGSRGGRDAVYDLLAERKQVKCLTGEDGLVHVRGARAVRCGSAQELRDALTEAFRWRSSEVTERNESSSRSHAIIELRLHSESVEGADPQGAEEPTGSLRIIDLAGSERNFETQLHTRRMAERGGHINYSLLMLKECARIMHRNRVRAGEKALHIPFRSSRLTHLLQGCFADEGHRTVVITTLSPSPTDVEHTLNSLQHVGMMREGCFSEHREVAGDKRTTSSQNSGGDDGSSFAAVQGRGHQLHSRLQDARSAQLRFKAFDVAESGAGGSVMKRYEPENVKKEAYIDPRWHRELNVAVEEDLWVLKEADAEVVQLLTEWREEQWEARRMHHVSRWDAVAVQAFLRSLDLGPGAVRLPSTMTGAQLCRLSRQSLGALCRDEVVAQALHEALQNERNAARDADASQAGRNAKMAALGNRKVYAALESAPSSAPPPSTPTGSEAQGSAPARTEDAP